MTLRLVCAALALTALVSCGDPELSGRYERDGGLWVSFGAEGVCSYAVGPFTSACTFTYESAVLTLSSPYGDRFSCALSWDDKEAFTLSECENEIYDGTYRKTA